MLTAWVVGSPVGASVICCPRRGEPVVVGPPPGVSRLVVPPLGGGRRATLATIIRLSRVEVVGGGPVGFGVSFKVAPGVRIRASSRGIRTSLGPRAARVHVGSGRTTVSSGFGPVTVWAGGPRRRSTRSSGRRSPRAVVNLSALDQQSAAAQRAEQIEAVMRLERSLLTLHLEDFPQAACPAVPYPQQPNVAALTAARQEQALKQLSIFDWTKRQQAKKWAKVAMTV